MKKPGEIDCPCFNAFTTRSNFLLPVHTCPIAPRTFPPTICCCASKQNMLLLLPLMKLFAPNKSHPTFHLGLHFFLLLPPHGLDGHTKIRIVGAFANLLAFPAPKALRLNRIVTRLGAAAVNTAPAGHFLPGIACSTCAHKVPNSPHFASTSFWPRRDAKGFPSAKAKCLWLCLVLCTFGRLQIRGVAAIEVWVWVW